jgi:dipeptidase E
MQLYLSSFEFGNEVDTLKRLAAGRRLGFIPNALDHVQPANREKSNNQRLAELRGLGIDAIVLDLASFFGKPDALRAAVDDVDGLWVRGGNTFVLRKAMRLSGFDVAMDDLMTKDFLYSGYSAGVCVLAPRLDGLKRVDDPNVIPYPDREPLWEGLGILDYLSLPHFQSNHTESAMIDQAVEHCTAEGIPFRTLRDGEVIVIEGFE